MRRQVSLQRKNKRSIPGNYRSPSSFLTKIRGLKWRKLLFVGLLFLGVLYSVVTIPVLRTVTFSVDRDLIYMDEDEIRLQLESDYLGRNWFRVRSGDIVRSLQSQYSEVLGVRAEKKFPYHLRVTVTPRIPVIRVKNEESGQEYLIDREAVVIHEATGEQLPSISVRGSFQEGNRLSSKEITFVLELLTSLDKIQIQDIQFQQGGTLLMELNTVRVLFSSHKEVSEQIALFELLQKQNKVRNGTLNTVDVRFDRPVITY
jgi:cell division septal protein FtsQ